MDTLVRDLRYALRQLRLGPGYAVLAIASIGIGIGATTTIFSLVEAFLLRPVPAVRADRLVYANETSADGSGFHSFSFLQYRDLRDRSHALSSLAAFDITPLSVATTGEAQLALGFSVSGNFFKTFGATPALGRFFLPEEDAYPDVGTHPVVVASHAFWERRLAGDSSAIGRTLRINGQTFTLIGVAQPEMSAMLSFLRADLWTPIAMSRVTKPDLRLDSRDYNTFQLVGRLADGMTREAAERELEGIAKQIETDDPSVKKGRGVDLFPFSGMPPEARRGVSIFMALLMSFSLLIVLVACGNLAGVTMARAVRRRRELAVRTALGASRARLVRQLVIETVLLFLGGSVAAIGLAIVATHAIARFKPPIDIPLELDIRVDGRVMVFALGLALVVGVVFALIPALRGTDAGVMATLKDEGANASRRSRARNVVVVAQIAFTLLLLIDAALVTRALGTALDVNPGFDTRDLRVAATNLQMRNYTADGGRRLLDQWRTALLARPGVRGVAFTSRTPLSLGNSTASFKPDGDASRNWISADFASVSNEYFGVMSIPLVAGRAFSTADRESSDPVAIVSAELARRYYKSPAAALGHLLRTGDSASDRLTIVGVAADTKVRSLAEEPRLMLYLPYGQTRVREVAVIIRGDIPGLARDVGATLRAIDGDLPVMSNLSFERHIGIALLPQQMAALVSATLGLIGLVLAAIGVYGIVAYAVSQRTREIGIRVAIGATPSGVARFMAGEGVRIAATGIGIGLALAIGGAQLLRSLLLGLNPYDPMTFVAAPLGLLIVAVVACAIPARRASKVDPVVALRAD
jgi:predicted permease